MKDKLLRILSTMIIIVGTLGSNLSPVIAMAVENEAEANSGEPTNIVKIIDQSLEDCRRILEGEATFQLPLEEKEPIDLVVIQDASGSFTENFPKVNAAICDIVSKLSDQDRVMLTTYQGGQYYQLANGTVIDNSRYDIPTKVSTVTPLTFDKEAFMQGYNTVTAKGTTPTALGLKEALSTYNKTHGDLTNRKTYFLLITDGVANVQLDGKVHKTNNTLNEYPAGQQGGVSVEYSSDYKTAAAEVLKLNNEVKDNGYIMINAFWESLEALSSPNSYYNRYKEVGAYVKDQLKAGADGPENYIVSNSIDDFTEQIKHLFDEKIAQVPDSTATLTIDDKFDIRSAVAIGEDGNELATQINNQKISVTVPGNYSGEVKIKYELKENAPIDEETTVSTGVVVQGESQKELPAATIEKNEHAHDCDIPPVEPSIEKDVEGKEHVDLGNRTDEFDWHVKATFGNDTSKWTQASMTDEINSVLEIKNVVVKDETGADVTANGDLSIKDNKIVFTLNKQDDSYSYLSGHEYTMTITTVIRADVTEAELAPYIKDGGIP
ncbi:isopeptide-forming domain-containing fimbrial protein, partial [Enterococcus phoeniculicola]